MGSFTLAYLESALKHANTEDTDTEVNDINWEALDDCYNSGLFQTKKCSCGSEEFYILDGEFGRDLGYLCSFIYILQCKKCAKFRIIGKRVYSE